MYPDAHAVGLDARDPAPEVAADNAGEEEKTANEKVGAEVKGASSGI